MGGMNAGQGTPVEYANFVNYWEADKNAEEEKKAKERAAAEEKKEKGKAVAVDVQNSKSTPPSSQAPSVMQDEGQTASSIASKDLSKQSTLSKQLSLKRHSANPLQIEHKKKHQNAPDKYKQKILEIDGRITAAVQSEDEQELLDQLNELLDQPFFINASPANSLPAEALTKAFKILNDCPTDPKEKDIDDRVKQFETELFVLGAGALSTKNTEEVEHLKKEIKERSIAYLKSNRFNVSNFQSQIISKFAFDKDDDELCSAQKMALETFLKSFPWVASKNSDAGVTLLKRLFVDVIPNLRDHLVAQENAQRRGLRVFEDGLKYLGPDQVAEALAEAMHSLAFLSQRFSIRRINIELGAVGRHPNRTIAAAGTASLIPVSVTAGLVWPGSIGSAAAVATAAVATGYAAIPIGVFVGGCALAAYLTTEKQAQGSALYMIGRQLNKLRKDWGNVSNDNRKRLQDSYIILRNSVDDLVRGVKNTSLTRFFNDTTIDPSKFAEEKKAWSERGRQINHRLLAPFITRMRSLPTSIDGLEDLSQDEKDLYHLLASYHNEARQLGLSTARMPVGLIKNVRKHANTPTYEETAVKILLACFIRPRENQTLLAGKIPMPEYENPLTKPKILQQIMEMTRRLAKGKEDFLHGFFNAAKIADGNCHVHGRQMLSELWKSVLADKAKRGENGLDKYENLLQLANGLFRVELLINVAGDVLYDKEDLSKNSEAVELIAAVQIALGKKLGLVDAVEGMDYVHLTKKVTSQALQNIETRFNDVMKERTAFVEFLVKWDPLTDKIKKDPLVNFDARLEKKKEAAKNVYKAAEETYFSVDPSTLEDPEKNQRIAKFEAAGEVFQGAKDKATEELLRERINTLLNEYSGSMELTDFSQINYYSVGNEYADIFEVPDDLDEGPWLAFVSAIKELEEEEGGGEIEVINEVAESMYIGLEYEPKTSSSSTPANLPTSAISPVSTSANLPNPASTVSPISKDDIRKLGFRVRYTTPDGDCLYHALGVAEQNIKAERAEVAAKIAARPEDELTMSANSYQVAGALLQTPSTMSLAQHLIRTSVPNRVYAELVKVPGIYSGLDELSAISTLEKYKEQIFFAVDTDGTLTEIVNGQRTELTYTDQTKTKVLTEALQRAQVRLYKTQGHWERIRIDKPVPQIPVDRKGKNKV
jgi:hypothetical protein